MSENNKVLIKVEDLVKYFNIDKDKELHAVDHISFEINSGETLGLVGESGCGKSTVGNVVMRLLPKTDGVVYFKGENIFSLPKNRNLEMAKNMQMVFQDPYSSLNPKHTIRQILSEAYEIHHIGSSKDEKNKKIEEICEETGIDLDFLERYPHELDGGTRQMVGIARALSLNPEFIVCDEPVSALDVSVQAKIINLLMDLQKQKNLSYLFISHDLSVVKHISHRIAVMYLGQFVEFAPTKEIFTDTRHPYSMALLSAVPRVDIDKKIDRIVLKGDVPSPINPKPGCRFAPRCWMATEYCQNNDPEFKEVSEGHFVRCHFCESSKEKLKEYLENNKNLKRKESE